MSNETLADILAEFRKFALRAAEEDKMISPESVLLLADKAEEAAEREVRDAAMEHAVLPAVCIKQGNAAAMREALMKIRDKCVIYNNDVAEEIDALCGNALSAPPRNCDRFKAADEARMAFWDTHETIWDAFKNRGGTELFYEVLDWLFAPAEGKEASNG